MGDSLGSFLGGPLVGIKMSEVVLEYDGLCDGFGKFGDFVLGGGGCKEGPALFFFPVPSQGKLY